MEWFDVAERVDYFRKYAESLDGGEAKDGNWDDYSKQAVKLECVVYPMVVSWYFVIPQKEQFKDAVRFALKYVGNGVSVTALAKRNGRFVCETFLSEKNVDSVFEWKFD